MNSWIQRKTMLNLGLRLAFGGLFSLVSTSLLAVDLTAVEYRSLGGGQAELRLQFNGTPPAPKSFAVQTPARLVVDLPEVSLRLADRSRELEGDLAQSWTAAESNGRSRLVVALSRSMPYQLRTEGSEVVVALNANQAVSYRSRNSNAASSPLGESAGTPPPANVNLADVHSGASLLDIDFRKGEQQQGRVLLTLSDPSVRTEVRRRGSRIIIELKNTRLPARLRQKFDVLDFGTPVKFIEARQSEQSTLVTVEPSNSKFEQLAYQADDLYVLELRPLTEKEVEDKFPYSGQRVNLNFQDIEVRALLEVLAEVADVNIIVSDSVKGNITMRLTNVPWDQALDIILKNKGLDQRAAGNVIYIAPLEELATREQKEREVEIAAQEQAPLQLELIQVNYTKAAAMASIISSEGSSILSERGSISIDERTNTLLVRDTGERLDEVRILVEQLDIPVKQVMIESRIVIANSNFTDELGVRWGATFIESTDDGLIGLSGSAEGNDAVVNDFLDNGFPVGIPSLNQRLNVNLPPGGRAGGFGLAILGANYLLDLELAALQAEGQGEVVSNPRVITADQRAATILQGTEVPFVNTTSDGGATVVFKEVFLSLNVTPQITPDERIVMELQVSKDDIGQVVQTAAGPAPSLTRRQVSTQVLVKDAETVVLGGIYETQRNDTETRVPFLGDIPLLGGLFRSRSKRNDKAELLIFVTPKIVREEVDLDY